MKQTFLKILGTVMLMVCLVGPARAGDFFFRDGDRVVFLGDSITEQRLYATFVEVYTLTRYPEWKLSFRNVGWGGDTAWLRQRAHPNEGQLFAADAEKQERMVEEAVARGLGRDVLPLKPTAVTIKFGMNDHAYQPFREDIFRAYSRSQTELVQVLKENGARVALLTPQPIEEKRADPDQDPKNQSLRKFSDGLKTIAQQESAVFVDQFDPYMKMLLRERAGNPANMIGAGDAVHPGPAGHLVMAWAVLQGLGAKALVSSVSIDVVKKESKTDNCSLEDLKVEQDQLSFTRNDKALPLPIDARAQAALGLAPILKDLSVYEMKITGLPQGDYQVSIDGTEMLRTTANLLAEGMNLSTAPGPITEQAERVLELVFKKNNVFFERWRSVQLHQFPGWANGPEVEAKREAQLSRLDREIEDLERQINETRQPKPRQFTIKRI
jgi:lysophospholipase L1-like esterase